MSVKIRKIQGLICYWYSAGTIKKSRRIVEKYLTIKVPIASFRSLKPIK